MTIIDEKAKKLVKLYAAKKGVRISFKSARRIIFSYPSQYLRMTGLDESQVISGSELADIIGCQFSTVNRTAKILNVEREDFYYPMRKYMTGDFHLVRSRAGGLNKEHQKLIHEHYIESIRKMKAANKPNAGGAKRRKKTVLSFPSCRQLCLKLGFSESTPFNSPQALIESVTGKHFDSAYDVRLTAQELEQCKATYNQRYDVPENALTTAEINERYQIKGAKIEHPDDKYFANRLRVLLDRLNIKRLYFYRKSGNRIGYMPFEQIKRLVKNGIFIPRPGAPSLDEKPCNAQKCDEFWNSKEQEKAALNRVDAMIAENIKAKAEGLPPVHWRAGYELKTRYAVA